MRLMHLGDLHFGKMVNGFLMIEDQEFVLEQIKQYIQTYRPDAVMLAGDIYDRSVPPARAVALYNQFLKDLLIELKTPVLAIAGNHDGAELIDFGHELFEAAQYYVAGNFTKIIKKVRLQDDAGPVNFYLLPFADYAVVREALNHPEIKSLNDAMKAIMEVNPIDSTERNVLITHAFVVGGEAPEQSESEKKLVVGGKESVDATLLEHFDYVALGHLHRTQRVNSDKIRYSGSLLKYSFSEEHYHKSMTMIDLDAEGEISIELLPLKPRRDMRTITGKLDELLTLEDEGQEDYLRVILTDEGELLEPMAKLRQVYPNVMLLELERRFSEFKGSQLSASARQTKSTEELFADFYEHHRGESLHEAGKQVIEQTIKVMKGEC
ncbi:exonuclease subunit SbcD [Turicibacter sanguinis]|uniref:exonuclease SbcCD subunit D n=1 Tax=Turicibacter sanguinis TaxID=154288 RepID=UPI001044F6B9|nr:exonuclease SbcCD subunit D [Turicibacter sanguinis]MCU7190728.1 exonuclease SbcCD subunit D [Turicibacter sanguinis]MCU7211274.1 exonuclease SbcCD subunit D [Turicibacter sanguinis]MDB8562880.1 exonuclease SbcCD subunit D [Turicibacter sanguinis]MTL75096.1 exonuclease subunit SbcD [Turicibacter sanguinis]MTP72971.1 exonuclease subunit SbcD [Turicibacter sanguinis]